MATYIDIRNNVIRNVIDLPSSVSSAVPGLVNYALRVLQQKHNYKVMEGSTTLTTSPSTHVLGAVPSTFKEYRARPWLKRNDGTVGEVTVVNGREDIWPEFDENDTGFPRFILQGTQNDLGEGNFEVYPISDTTSDYPDHEYRVVIPYWRYLPALSADGDSNWITNQASGEKYIEFRATAEAFALDWDAANQSIWLQKAENERREVERVDKMLRLSGHDTLVPQWRGANSARVRW